MRNDEVADRLEEMADRLEALDVAYKPRAYRRAAERIRGHTVAIERLAAEGETAVTELDRVGDAIAAKVVEYVETGEIGELNELRRELPADIDALTAIEGVGPKTVAALHEALGVTDLDDLEAAARDGRIREVSGFGLKTEANILEGIPFARRSHGRELLGDARPVAERVLGHLRDRPGVERAEAGGSLRRWRATVGDVDVLAASADGEAVVDALLDWEGADDVIEAGTGKASVRADGLRVDLRVVAPDEYGAALQYFTGSRDHNIRVRNRAIERGLKVNEYGVFDVSDVADPDAGQRVGERVAGADEAAVYGALGLDPIPPELREDRGEVATAAEGRLPDLVTETDVRGDLHVHTDRSDGSGSLREMLAAAAAAGHEYVAITDHATGPGMVGGVGLDDGELREWAGTVRATAADAEADLAVLAGVEANIDREGGLSVGESVLAALDCVVASPHAGLDGDGTDRLVAAVEHPEVDVLGHPTGRLLNRRAGLDVDAERLAAAAAAAGTALEVNANPSRLDLRGGYVATAVEAGATIAINTDAHAPGSYGLARFGVHTARRGWAEPADVLNARDADGVRAFLDA